jgi:hypothetical protein
LVSRRMSMIRSAAAQMESRAARGRLA